MAISDQAAGSGHHDQSQLLVKVRRERANGRSKKVYPFELKYSAGIPQQATLHLAKASLRD
jgi:hypothetical protein